MTAKRPLILVGPLPPPRHGLSVTFELMCDELVALGIEHRVVDTADRHHWPLVPRLVRRLIEWIAIAARYLLVVARRRTTVYLIITQSLPGFLRDAFVVTVAAMMRHRIVLHANCGNFGGFWRAQPRIVQRVIARVLRMAEVIVIPSERLVAMFDFEPRLAGGIRIVPNAAHTSVEPTFRGKEAPGQEIRLVYLSNFIATKGYKEVIHTVKILRQDYGLPITCELVGEFLVDGSAAGSTRLKARAQLKRAITDEQLEEFVTVRPPADAERRLAILRDSHFLLLPTRYEIEAQPLAIIEAMAAGCVPVAPAYRAIPDLIVDGLTGLLVEPHAEEMARAIAELYADPRRYTAMSKAAAARHRDRFTAEQHLLRMRNLLMPGIAFVRQAPAPGGGS